MAHVLPGFVQDFGDLGGDQDRDTMLTPEEFENTCYYLVDDAATILQEFLDALYGPNQRRVQYGIKM